VTLDDLSGGTVSRTYTVPSTTPSTTSNSSGSASPFGKSIFAVAADALSKKHNGGASTKNKLHRSEDEIKRAQNEANNIYVRRDYGLNSQKNSFDNRTPEQKQAFEFFANVELNTGRNITVSGKNALYKAHDAVSKGATTGNTTTAFGYLNAAANAVPGDVSGMLSDNNGVNKVKNAFTKKNIEQFKQMSPDEKQKVYDKVNSELEYHNGQIESIKKEMDELKNYNNLAKSYYLKYPNNPNIINVPDKSVIEQKTNQKENELHAQLNNDEKERQDALKEIAELRKACDETGGGCYDKNN